MPEETRAEPSVGLTIARARQRKRMTQKQLARKLRVSTSTVANWEGGKHFPLRHAGAVEALLGIELPEREELAG